MRSQQRGRCQYPRDTLAHLQLHPALPPPNSNNNSNSNTIVTSTLNRQRWCIPTPGATSSRDVWQMDGVCNSSTARRLNCTQRWTLLQ